MCPSKAAVAAKVASVIATHGQDVDVLKYVSSATASIYKQRLKTFASPVTLKGHITYDADTDKATPTGEEKTEGGSITFARTTLETALAADVLVALTLSDELGFHGHRWRIDNVHLTGTIEGEPQVVSAKFSPIPGRAVEVYP